MKIVPKVFVGGTTVSVIDSIYRISQQQCMPLALMFTENQCGLDGGYIGAHEDVMDRIKVRKAMYPDSNVIIARDHFSPKSLSSNHLAEYLQFVELYAQSGYNYIHLDFDIPDCPINERVSALEYCVRKIRSLPYLLTLEVSLTPDDDINFISEISSVVSEIISINPDVVVLPTGSKVYNGKQVGEFNLGKVFSLARLLQADGISVKEHNADFLTKKEISVRSGVMNSMNIAPEIGVLKNSCIQFLSCSMGLDISDVELLASECSDANKWMPMPSESPSEAFKLCGHYICESSQYLKLVSQLGVDLDQMAGFVFDRAIRRYLND